jgi:hypothetical protein
MRKLLFAALIVLAFSSSFAQQNVGIGTNNPQSKLDVNGSMGTAFTTLGSGVLTLDQTNSTVLASPNTTINLPQASSAANRIYTIIYNGPAAGPAMTINAFGGDHIGLAGTATYSAISVTEGTIILQSAGSSNVWYATVVAASAGSGNYIQNQTSSTQAAGFNIGGNGIFNGGNVVINDPTPSSAAILDIASTNKGMLPPRMTTAQRNAITAGMTSTRMQAIQGLSIFNINTNCLEAFIGTSWQPLGCGCTSAPAQPGAITYTPNGGTICQGYTNFVFSVAEVAGASSYNWSLPSGVSVANGSGTSTITINFSNTAASGSQTVSVTSQNSCGVSTAATLPITVNAIPVITSQPNSATICAQGGAGNTGNAGFTAQATGTALVYQWQVNTGTGGWTNLVNGGVYSNVSATNVGTSTLNITGASTAYSGYQYQCVISGTCTPAVTTIPVTLTVNPVPSITATAPSICSGTGPNVSLTSLVSTPSTFTWTLGTITNGITGATAGNGTLINQTLTQPSSTLTGTVPYVVVPTSTTGSCVGSSTTITVTVTPIPIVTTAATATICSGGTTAISLVDGGVSSTYAWTIGTITNGITGSANGSGSSIAQTLTNPINTAAGTVPYIVTPTSTTNSCQGNPYTITVTVNPTPVVTTPNAASICSGATTAITLTGSVTSTYAWTLGANTGGITTPVAGSGTSIAQTLTNPSNATAGSIVYNVVPTALTCVGPSYPITVTVNPKPVVTNGTTASICSATGPNITLASSAPSSFAWTLGSITNGVTGASASSGNSLNQILTEPGSTLTGTVPYIVVPTTTTGSCAGASTTITVTVTPTPAITTAATATICSGGPTAISLVDGGVASSYAWTIGTITNGITGASNGSGSSIAQTLADPNPTSGSVVYNVVPTSTTNSCVGANYPITVTVNPLPTVTAAAGTNPVCQNATTTLTATPAGGSGVYSSYLWASGTTGNGMGASTSASNSATPTSGGTQTYTVKVTDNNGCQSSAAGSVNVTVNALPTVTVAAGTNPVCLGGSTTLTATPAGGSGTYSSYLWASSTTGNGMGGSTTSTNSATPTASGTQTYTVKVTDNNNCQSSAAGSVNIAVYAGVGGSISGGTSPVCNNTSPGTFTATGSGGTGSYTYLWYLNSASTGTTTQTYTSPNLTTGANTVYCAVSSSPCGTANTSTTTIGVGPCYSNTTCGSAGNWIGTGSQYIGANNMTCAAQTTSATFVNGSYFQWDGVANQTYQMTINGTGWTTPAWQFWQVVGGVWTYVTQGTGTVASVTPTITSPVANGWTLIVVFNGTACPPTTPPNAASITYQRTTGPIPTGASVSSACWSCNNSNTYTVSASAINSSNMDYGYPGAGYGIMALINYQGTDAGAYGGYFDWAPTQALLTGSGFTANQSACTSGTGWVGQYPSGYGSGACTLVSGSVTTSGMTTTANFVVRPTTAFPAENASNGVSVYAGDPCSHVNGWNLYQLNFSSSSGGSQTFSYSGAATTFTVPTCATSVTITAKGAQGGTSTGSGTYAGGTGAIITGTFAVSGGQVLKVLVGGQGGSGWQGGGGGGSFVTTSANGAMCIAGGGGGGYYGGYSSGSGNMTASTSTSGNPGMDGSSGAAGGAGGSGGNGGGCAPQYAAAEASGGGGLSGNGSGCYGSAGGSSFTNGGAGGAGDGCVDPTGSGGFGGGGGSDWCSWTGGGGGGGYSGGGGGTYYGCGGGGGSYNGGTSPSNTTGNTGNGSVVISW